MIELYPHNKQAYENVLKDFETSNKTCVIHPTGTGKSFISLKWLYDNKDKKCLFLTSSNIIIDQLIEYIEKSNLSLDDFPNLELMPYHSLKDNGKKYDCIVLDEFHRCGAKEWGKEVNQILDNNKDSKILGISATPIRYLDNQRDMSEELFDGNIASKMSLAQAVARKILPVPKYINCIYSFKDKIDKIQELILKEKNIDRKNELQKRLDDAKKELEKVDGLSDIFEKYLPNKKGKYVVFCKDKKHLEQMKQEVNTWFSKINNLNIFTIISDYEKEMNRYNINRFENVKDDSIDLLFSIEMLNEGLHTKGIDGVIMLRSTYSPIIYFQQLGRALSTNSNKPIIFDIVNNSESFDSIYSFRNELEQVIDDLKIEYKEQNDDEKTKELDEILKEFIVIDQYKEMSDILDNISLDATFTWEDWYNLAKTYYENHGDLIVPHRYKTKDGISEDNDGYSLGNWIMNQRSKKKTLPQSRVDMLNKIGMEWESVKNINFEKWYSLAKNYYNYYGHLNVPDDFKTKDGITENESGIELGKIIAQKRRGQNSSKVINALDEIGMIWDLRKYNKDTKYDLAKKYYEHYGNLDIKDNFKTEDGITKSEKGINLANWIHKLRCDYSDEKLSEEEISRMNEIGMIWDKPDEIWNSYYELAKKHFEEKGNLNLKSRFKTINGIDEDPNGLNLGGWLQRQKTDYVNKRLSPIRIKKLEDIGIIWNNKEDNFIRSEIKNQEQITEYLYNKLNSLLENYSNMKLENKNDIDNLNHEFNDSIYIAKTK